nr:hypothetical protein PITG_05283 [Albugo laibachii Nc14]|eukprot:CCA27549.1 hypothetical protein PITG_05283 [Albugo laibachii Nc14]
MKSSKALEWSKTLEEKNSALLRLGAFEVITRLRDSKALHSKWVFKTMTDAEDRAEQFKARLVACGNKQKFVSIFQELLLWSWISQHGDVPNAYAQTDKENELDILLHLPSGMKFTIHEIQKFGAKSAGELVLRQKKTLYGLKKAGRLWSQLLHEKLSEAGFERGWCLRRCPSRHIDTR